MQLNLLRAGLGFLLLIGVATPAIAQAPTPTDNYVIGPRDVLTITVFGEQDISKAYTVEADGKFSFKWIGRVQAAGLTIPQLEASMKKLLVPDYLVNPQISMAVEHFRSKQILVSGEVRSAGSIPLTGGMRLLEALVKAGGPLPTAAGDVIVSHANAVRPIALPPGVSTTGSGTGDGSGETDTVRIDMGRLQSGSDSDLNIELLDGDSVYVPRADTVYVFGEVKSPGGFPAPKGTTVLQALSLAGGMTPDANRNKIQINRNVGGKSLEVKNVKLTDLVQPGDVVVVAARIF